MTAAEGWHYWASHLHAGPLTVLAAADRQQIHTIHLPGWLKPLGHLFSAHPPLLEHAMILAGIDLSNPQASIDTLLENFVAKQYATGEADPDMKAGINAAIAADVQLAKLLLKKYAANSTAVAAVEKDAQVALTTLEAKHPNLAGLIAQLKANLPAGTTI